MAATLRAEGVHLDGQPPRRVAAEDLRGASRIVAFGCDLGGLAPGGVAIEQWDDIPAVSEDFTGARAAIDARLPRLLEDVTTQP